MISTKKVFSRTIAFTLFHKARFHGARFCGAVLLGTTILGATNFATAAEVSANVTLASDYLFRGVSQTDEKGAIQGGFDFVADSGLYIGTWASNVNFGTDSSTEIDLYIGFAGETAGEIGYDVSVIYFDYEGDSEFDYQEIAFSISLVGVTFGLNYSDEYLGDGGPTFLYPYVDYSYSLPSDYSLNFHVGLTDLDVDGVFEPSEDSYVDYSIGISKEFDGIEVSLSYVDTTIDDLDLAEGRGLLTISKSL